MRFGRKQALSVATVVVVVVSGLLAFWMVDNYASGASQASPGISLDVEPSGNTGTSAGATSQASPAISLDVEPSGNTATSVGTIDACNSAAAGTTFDVDVVVQDLPGLDGYQLDLLYSPSVLSITAIEPGLFLGPEGVDFSDTVPDSDGHVLLQYANMEGPSRSGSGALARVTFQTVGSGLAPIKLVNVILGQSGGEAIGDSDGDNLFDGPVVDAFVAVDQRRRRDGSAARAPIAGAPRPAAYTRAFTHAAANTSGNFGTRTSARSGANCFA